MSMEFGWWVRDPRRGNTRSRRSCTGNLQWLRKQGHFTSWMPHKPNEENWDKLIYEAERRVPRRLLSPKQFDEIKRLRDQR